MALIIPTFKKGLITTTNAYAKVVRVQVDNNTKKANFNVVIYKSKEDRTLLSTIPTQVIDTVIDVDIIKQCYDSIDSKITEVETQISELQTEVDAGNKQGNKIFRIATLKASPILVLKNTTDDL